LDLTNVRASSASEFLAKVLLSAILGAVSAAGPVSVRADGATPAPAEPQENPQGESSASPAPLAQSICEVLAAAAAANDLPAEFFTRLIWQESRFRPEAVSHAGAQGVAQFMPGHLGAESDQFRRSRKNRAASWGGSFIWCTQTLLK
jgi:soluble lytic murein transglycosylase-like protein